jgi:hypothetical protein
MRIVALPVALVAGCATTTATTPRPDSRIASFEQQSQQIDRSQHRCISEAMTSNVDQIANVGESPENTAKDQMRKQVAERDLKVSECEAKAKQQRDDLTARAAKAYQEPALEEREDSSLMMILTGSRPH